MPIRVLRRSALLLAVGLTIGLAGASAIARQADEAPAAKAPTPAPEAKRQAVGTPVSVEKAVPIKRIMLYRSGVGYFERSGEIDGNAELQLRFKTEQINDILKSMVLLDLSGGRVESVSYGSKEPLERRLASFGINISGNPSVADLLNQLRGAVIKLTVAGDIVTGTILGVELRQMSSGKDQPLVPVQYINLVTADGIRSISVPDVMAFELQDRELAGELAKALAAVAEYRADRSKSVELRFSGSGSRKVLVSYVHEMPVWKTSYRLVLPDTASPSGDKVVMQAWAIVENTTDQDWSNVQLGLVSGRPISFQMDLYEPLFSFRQFVPVPTIPGVSPRIFALGIDDAQLAEGEEMGRSAEAMMSNALQSQRSQAPGSGRPGRPRGTTGGVMYDAMSAAPATAPASPAPAPPDLAGAIRDGGAASTAVAVGETFQFLVDAPVSIERQKSAMIPIMSGQITGRRVSIYNAADGSQFPMRGVELTNDSPQAMLPGPITVFDGAAYAGDAQIGQIAKGDKRFLAYSLDLDVAVNVRPTTKGDVTQVVIRDGVLIRSMKDRTETVYEIANKDTAKPRTIILEHPKAGNYTLVDTEKPTETTQDLYRFTLSLEPAKARKFTVATEQVRDERYDINGLSLDSLLSYRASGKVSEGVIKAVQDAAAKQTAIAQTTRSIEEIATKIEEIASDQSRIRQNMAAVNRDNNLYTTYITRLTKQETDLDQLREQKITLQRQLDQQKADLAKFLSTLTVK